MTTNPEMNAVLVKLLRENPNNPVDLYAAQRIEELEVLSSKDSLKTREINVLVAENRNLISTLVLAQGYIERNGFGADATAILESIQKAQSK